MKRNYIIIIFGVIVLFFGMLKAIIFNIQGVENWFSAIVSGIPYGILYCVFEYKDRKEKMREKKKEDGAMKELIIIGGVFLILSSIISFVKRIIILIYVM